MINVKLFRTDETVSLRDNHDMVQIRKPPVSGIGLWDGTWDVRGDATAVVPVETNTCRVHVARRTYVLSDVDMHLGSEITKEILDEGWEAEKEVDVEDGEIRRFYFTYQFAIADDIVNSHIACIEACVEKAEAFRDMHRARITKANARGCWWRLKFLLGRVKV